MSWLAPADAWEEARLLDPKDHRVVFPSIKDVFGCLVFETSWLVAAPSTSCKSCAWAHTSELDGCFFACLWSKTTLFSSLDMSRPFLLFGAVMEELEAWRLRCDKSGFPCISGNLLLPLSVSILFVVPRCVWAQLSLPVFDSSHKSSSTNSVSLGLLLEERMVCFGFVLYTQPKSLGFSDTSYIMITTLQSWHKMWKHTSKCQAW